MSDSQWTGRMASGEAATVAKEELLGKRVPPWAAGREGGREVGRCGGREVGR